MFSRDRRLPSLLAGLAPGAALAILLSSAPPVRGAVAKGIQLTVRVALTDLDNKPLAGVPVRFLEASQRGWQNGAAGVRQTTDSSGHAFFTTAGGPSEGRRGDGIPEAPPWSIWRDSATAM